MKSAILSATFTVHASPWPSVIAKADTQLRKNSDGLCLLALVKEGR